MRGTYSDKGGIPQLGDIVEVTDMSGVTVQGEIVKEYTLTSIDAIQFSQRYGEHFDAGDKYYTVALDHHHSHDTLAFFASQMKLIERKDDETARKLEYKTLVKKLNEPEKKSQLPPPNPAAEERIKKLKQKRPAKPVLKKPPKP